MTLGSSKVNLESLAFSQSAIKSIRGLCKILVIDGSAFGNCQRIEKGMKHMSQTGITFSGGFRLTNQDKCAKCFITLQDNPEIRDSVCQISETLAMAIPYSQERTQLSKVVGMDKATKSSLCQ